ncbi:hypothetical protein B0J12DRAFT_724553 [Macrophomina phaseolina]|uniref:Uncharacterized protein n=1 Tax=Macrophomina phaseolina TaxID=35725 RepID=A0ABQ8GQR5_9PEZI|nr:hypothetical protein B0J12DRAFT_724553 [Macrophomina phaseolina]
MPSNPPTNATSGACLPLVGIITPAFLAQLNMPPLVRDDDGNGNHVPNPRLPPLGGRPHARDFEAWALQDLRADISIKRERDGQHWTERVRCWGGGVAAHVAVLGEMRREAEEREQEKGNEATKK